MSFIYPRISIFARKWRKRWKCKCALQKVKWTSENKLLQGKWSPSSQQWTRRTRLEDVMLSYLHSKKDKDFESLAFIWQIAFPAFRFVNSFSIQSVNKHGLYVFYIWVLPSTKIQAVFSTRIRVEKAHAPMHGENNTSFHLKSSLSRVKTFLIFQGFLYNTTIPPLNLDVHYSPLRAYVRLDVLHVCCFFFLGTNDWKTRARNICFCCERCDANELPANLSEPDAILIQGRGLSVPPP